MSYCEEIRRHVEGASRAALPAITAALWRAYGDGKVTEAEAAALSGLIETRLKAPADRRTAERADDAGPLAATGLARRYGSRPRTDASMARRRRWAASGRLPPGLACRFTLAEQAVLSLVAAESAKRNDCRLTIDHMAAVTGVSRSTVKTAIREARKFGLLTVEERTVSGGRNLPNVVRIASSEWTAWTRLARRETRFSSEGGWGQFCDHYTYKASESGKAKPCGSLKKLPRDGGSVSGSASSRFVCGSVEVRGAMGEPWPIP